MTPTSLFVLLLVVAMPNAAATLPAIAEHHLEFKTRADCERFRDSVTTVWNGGDQPKAWAICVEKPI